jgi:hypothetical protein
MVLPILQPAIAQLTEATSMALLQHLQRQAIATPLQADAIDTAFVRWGKGADRPPLSVATRV